MKMPTPSPRFLLAALLVVCAATLAAERHARMLGERAARLEERLQMEADRAKLRELEGQLAAATASCHNCSGAAAPSPVSHGDAVADANLVRQLAALRNVTDVKERQLAQLTKQVGELQVALDQQVQEKVAMSNMLLANGTERKKEWGAATLSPEAVAAAATAVEECGRLAAAASPKGAAGCAGGAGGFGPQCQATAEEMARYLDYEQRGDCPEDWFFVQKLIFTKGCHCLPRRVCRARSPPHYRDPLPTPQALWDPAALRDENVLWGSHACKSYACVNGRKLGDCPNCFNLTLEALRWRLAKRGTIRLADVLALKPPGTLRLGLDAGGGTGSFAAKMAAHNCTVLTTAMDVETLFGTEGGLPYMETIAQRGLVPLHLPHAARLPLFDNTLDLVHSVNSIKYPLLPEFETLLFEWDRVLRPGGILWLELFYAPVAEMPLYVGVLDVLAYARLYWNISPKTDRPERPGPHVYLNCVLEKPRRPAPPVAPPPPPPS